MPFRTHRRIQRVRFERVRILDYLVVGTLLLAGAALFFADMPLPFASSPAWAISGRFNSTDLALTKFLVRVQSSNAALTLAALPSIRYAPDRAWGGRVSDLDFDRPASTGRLEASRSMESTEGSGYAQDPQEFSDHADAVSMLDAPSTTRGSSHGGAITSEFGFRRMGGTVRHHDGVDVSFPMGTPIHAHEDGVVTYAGWRNGYGLTVILDHGFGKETLYAHASSLKVRVGQTVGKGETIAAVGATGRAYGTHLHFEIRRGGVPVDPEREYRSSPN